jgi:hypothetical protein
MNITPEQVIAAIYRVEGGTHTSHPYGVLTHYAHTSPHDACLNTVNHALRDYKLHSIDRAFITFLSERYCPPSCDKQGNANWKNNAIKILHL